MTSQARRLRADPTDADGKLWRALRRDQILGLNFRRQHPVGPYTLDFYCPHLRLAVEVDGGQHAEAKKQADARRTRWLASKGIVVVRFWNNEVLQNLEGVLTELIRAAHEQARSLTLSLTLPLTLPLSGGGDGEAAPRGESPI